MTKKQEHVPAVQPAPDAEEAAYHSLVKRAIDVTRSLAMSEIEWYWRVGEVFKAFTDAQEKRQIGVRTVEQFAAALAEEGFPIGKSTLFFAKAVHERYRLESIPEMVQHGMRIGHLKLLQRYDGDELKSLQTKMVTPDGKVITVEALNDEINRHRRVTANEANKAITKPDQASAPEKKDITVTPEEDKDFFGEEVPATATAAAPAVPDDGKTGSRGMTTPKEFSVKSPLKAMKDVEGAASRLSSVLADAYIVVKEAPKVGFDSDKAHENFKVAYANAVAALKEAIEPAQKLLELMEGSKGDI